MNTREHLPREQISLIFDAATRAGLAHSRSALLAGIDQGFVSSLPHGPNAGAQLLLDLTELNQVTALVDGAVPLFDWLSNATRLTGPRYEADVFRVALKAVKLAAGASEAPPASPRRQPVLELDVQKFWADPRGSALHQVVKVAYGELSGIKVIAAISGVGMSGVAVTGGVGDIWFDLLSVAIRSATIKRLFEVILDDDGIAFYHPQIRKLVS